MLKRIRTECGADSWWRPQSWRKSVDIAKGQGIEAQKAIYDEMKSDPEPLGSEAEMGLAEIAVARNENDEALALYQKVGANTSSPHAETAKVGAFRMLKTLKKTGELDSYSQRLLSDSTTSPALQQAAGAWVATSLLEKAGKDRGRIRGAIQAAAKAIAMGPPYGRDDAQDYVAALRVAAKGWALLGADAKPEVKEEYRQRALGYLTEIVRAYKDTPWAESAKLEMQALGASEK
jgi:tetratricopeptide (TPR) repeat protein